MKKEDEITQSWALNAREWSRLIEEDGIASREFTNPAIIEIVKKYEPMKILDLGCGEGWLTRALTTKSTRPTGADATEALLEIARTKGPQNFYRFTYEQIIAGVEIPEAKFDAVVLNFCLYQKEEVPTLLKALKKTLSASGFIFIQTLHPSFLLLNNFTYEDQWISDSWKGLKGNFIRPHSWYARTMESWLATFKKCRLELVELKEISNDNRSPLSVIFVLTPASWRLFRTST